MGIRANLSGVQDKKIINYCYYQQMYRWVTMFRDGADVALSSFRCKKCPDPDPEYASLPFAHTPPCHWIRGRRLCEKEEEDFKCKAFETDV